MFPNETITHNRLNSLTFEKFLKPKHVVWKEEVTKCQIQMAFWEKLFLNER